MRHQQQIADFESAIDAAILADRATVWTALPGIIHSYDPKAVTVEVQPTIKGVIQQRDGNARAEKLPILPDVPVIFPRGGGVTFTFPIQIGDECLVVFSSRCIDGWWQSGGVQLAPELRHHDLADGFAIIGPQSQAEKISDLSTDTAQIRTDDGQAYIEWNPASHDINLKTPGDVSATVGGDVTATIDGTMTGKAKAWNITGPVNIDGPLTVTEGITAGTGSGGGNVETSGDVVGNGISLDQHTHPGDSGGTTGEPN